MLSSDSRFQDRIRSHRRVPGPYFGGRSALKGPLEFYLNGHLEALSSENKGRLTGFGTSPEGVENNEILYELISAASWSDSRVDLDTFLEKYSRARYGECDPAFMEFWNELRQSVYDNFTNNARFLWQLRPAYHRVQTMNINEHYFKGPGTTDGLEREVGIYLTIEGGPQTWGTISLY